MENSKQYKELGEDVVLTISEFATTLLHFVQERRGHETYPGERGLNFEKIVQNIRAPLRRAAGPRDSTDKPLRFPLSAYINALRQLMEDPRKPNAVLGQTELTRDDIENTIEFLQSGNKLSPEQASNILEQVNMYQPRRR